MPVCLILKVVWWLTVFQSFSRWSFLLSLVGLPDYPGQFYHWSEELEWSEWVGFYASHTNIQATSQLGTKMPFTHCTCVGIRTQTFSLTSDPLSTTPNHPVSQHPTQFHKPQHKYSSINQILPLLSHPKSPNHHKTRPHDYEKANQILQPQFDLWTGNQDIFKES